MFQASPEGGPERQQKMEKAESVHKGTKVSPSKTGNPMKSVNWNPSVDFPELGSKGIGRPALNSQWGGRKLKDPFPKLGELESDSSKRGDDSRVYDIIETESEQKQRKNLPNSQEGILKTTKVIYLEVCQSGIINFFTAEKQQFGFSKSRKYEKKQEAYCG